MNIQELGSLGEFIGAIAVMVTLVYLAIQTRLTRKAAEETAKFSSMQMTQGVADMYSRWRLARMNPDLAQLLVKARGGSEQLTDAEQEIYSAASEELFFTAYVSYESAVESASFHPDALDIVYLLDIIKTNPKLISEWQRMHQTLMAGSARFVATIDRCMEEQGIVKHEE
jgi:hypothetical protein